MTDKLTTEEMVNEIVEWILDESRDTLTREASDQLSAGWNYLRWYPESLEEMRNGNFGRVVSGLEASPSYPESEYFSRGNHPITFWSDQTNPGWSSPETGGLEWVECTHEEAAYLACNLSPKNNSVWASAYGRWDYACSDDEEQILRLAAKAKLGDFDDVEQAVGAILKAGGFWFNLGQPVDGIDTEDLEKELAGIVLRRIEQLESEENAD